MTTGDTRGLGDVIHDLRKINILQHEQLEEAHADIVVLNGTVDRLEDTIERYRAAGYGWPE